MHNSDHLTQCVLKNNKIIEQQARSLFPPTYINQLKVIRNHRVLIATCILYSQLIVAWWAALIGPPIIWIFSFIIICACISAMQLWVHESAHFSIFSNRKINDIWADIFFGSPFGGSVKVYRQFHMTHHLHMSTPKDLDRFAFNVSVQGHKALVRLFLRGLLCIESYKIFTQKYTIQIKPIKVFRGSINLVSTVLWNILLLLVCVLANRWYLYFILWVYPILGITVTINSIRSISEHLPVGFSSTATVTQDITPMIRTTVPSFLEKWFIFQANFNFHFEHHLFPTVPAGNLPLLHKYLVKNGFYEQHPYLLQTSALVKLFELSNGKQR